jgi:hypothetical protein
MTWRRALGKVIGILSGTTCAGLAAIFILANPYGPTTVERAGVWIIILPGIGVAGVLAVIAALYSARRTLVGLFIISFFPFSLYLMLTSGIGHWFGVAQFGYVVAAALVSPKRDA